MAHKKIERKKELTRRRHRRAERLKGDAMRHSVFSAVADFISRGHSTRAAVRHIPAGSGGSGAVWRSGWRSIITPSMNTRWTKLIWRTGSIRT